MIHGQPEEECKKKNDPRSLSYNIRRERVAGVACMDVNIIVSVSGKTASIHSVQHDLQQDNVGWMQFSQDISSTSRTCAGNSFSAPFPRDGSCADSRGERIVDTVKHVPIVSDFLHSMHRSSTRTHHDRWGVLG